MEPWLQARRPLEMEGVATRNELQLLTKQHQRVDVIDAHQHVTTLRHPACHVSARRPGNSLHRVSLARCQAILHVVVDGNGNVTCVVTEQSVATGTGWALHSQCVIW